MKRKIYALLFLILNISCSNKYLVKEGLLSIRIINLSKPINAEYSIPLIKKQIWFRDSSVIYEVIAIIENTNYNDTGTVHSIMQEVLKYTFLNLRNFSCQDYLNFSDTATLFSNYYLKAHEQIGWKFYREKQVFDSTGVLSSMNDTTIGTKNYKRLMLLNSQKNLESVFYLDCESKNTIFHINRWLDEKYASCQVVKSERRFNLLSQDKETFELILLKKRFDETENRIFKQWAENALKTNMPVISAEEAEMKLFPPVIENDSTFDLRYKK